MAFARGLIKTNYFDVIFLSATTTKPDTIIINDNRINTDALSPVGTLPVNEKA